MSIPKKPYLIRPTQNIVLKNDVYDRDAFEVVLHFVLRGDKEPLVNPPTLPNDAGSEGLAFLNPDPAFKGDGVIVCAYHNVSLFDLVDGLNQYYKPRDEMTLFIVYHNGAMVHHWRDEMLF